MPRSVSNRGSYRSFVLRLWQSAPGGDWRASVQDVQSGERHHFADLNQLQRYLLDRTVTEPMAASDPFIDIAESDWQRLGDNACHLDDKSQDSSSVEGNVAHEGARRSEDTESDALK